MPEHRGARRDSPLRALLASGDRRELGQAARVAREILAHPALVGEAVASLRDADPAVAAHAAHALMQVARERPDLFAPHVDALCDLLEGEPQWEIGEQVPKVLAAAPLSLAQAQRLVRLLEKQVSGRSAIAAASALSGMVAMAQRGWIDTETARTMLAAALTSPRKALAARARVLIAELAERR